MSSREFDVGPRVNQDRQTNCWIKIPHVCPLSNTSIRKAYLSGFNWFSRTNNTTASERTSLPKAQENPSKGAKKSQRATVEDASDDEEDMDYAPPKKPRNEPPSPNRVHDSNGEENISDTEYGAELVHLNHF